MKTSLTIFLLSLTLAAAGCQSPSAFAIVTIGVLPDDTDLCRIDDWKGY